MTGYKGFQLVSSLCFDWEVVAYEIWLRMMNVRLYTSLLQTVFSKSYVEDI